MSASADHSGAGAWLPGRWLRLAHLATLWAFAFVQPLLDLVGRNPDFFVARGNGRADILVFAFALVTIPPLCLLAVEEIAGRVRVAWGRLVHLVVVGALAAAIALGLVNELDLSGALLMAFAAGWGVAVALLYIRSAAGRSLVSFLTPAPLAFLALFLLASDASDLVLPQAEVDPYDVAATTDAPVVLMVFDELPAATLMQPNGSIDARHFPNFARLAAGSTWYRQATTVADRSAQAVPSILTGSRPESEVEPTAAEYPDSLFTLLGGGGRELNGFESTTRLCPTSLCRPPSEGSLGERLGDLSTDLTVVSQHLLLPEALADGLPPVDQTFSDFAGSDESGSEVESGDAERVESLIDGLDAGSNDLNYIHVDAPHVPWTTLPDGRSCQDETWAALDWIDDSGEWPDEPWVLRQALALHLLQAAYADRLLGRLVAGLRSAGIWERAVVVVVSDHGVAFEPGEPRRTLTAGNAGAVVRVPLFVKTPGQGRPRVSDIPARTIDILPTITRLIGANLPFEVDGVPVAEVPAEETAGVFTRGSGTVDVELAALERDRERMTREKARLLGPGRGFGHLFAAGPRPDLSDAEVEPMLSAQADPEGEAALVEPEAFAAVEPDSGSMPCQLVAELEGVEVGAPLAAAVNGQVVATMRAYDSSSGRVQAFAPLDPRAFQAGANEVEVLRIDGDGPTATSLVPLGDG